MIHVIVFSIVTFLKKKETVNYDTEKKLKKKKDLFYWLFYLLTKRVGVHKKDIQSPKYASASINNSYTRN